MSNKGFIVLHPVPGGRFDRFLHRNERIPKNPDKLVDMFVDQYGVDAVVNMSEIDIGDYVFNKGLVHSQNMNVGRSIPWIDDGLKAVERRILFIMHQAKLYGGKFDKVAGVAGDMIKYVHPHGEQSAEDTIYRLGRSRSTMIPYIEPKGNYGNMHTMRPASSRYASASLSKYAVDCFFSEVGAKRPIYDEKDNYKYSSKEPVFLTSKYPNMLLQWNQGIGKGASAWLGAFNSKDLFKVAIKMLDDPECKVDIYPDTPIPVDIVNKAELKGCFDQVKFKVKMRAQYHVVDDKKRDDHGRVVDKHTIVFTSLPLAVTGKIVTDELKAIKLADKSRADKKLPEVISAEPSANDNTPGGIELYIEYEEGYDPEAIVEKLYTMTSLAKTVGVQYALISDYKPDLYTPRQLLKTWIMYRFDQKRRYYHQMVLKYAKDRSRLDAIGTILESKDATDRAIKIIRGSRDDAATKAALMKAFDFSEFQAVSVMKLQLKSLAKLNIEDIKAERAFAHSEYKRYRKMLTEDDAIKNAIREDLEDGLRKYGKDRIATVMNLKDKGLGNASESKHIIYDSDMFYAVPGDAKLCTLKGKLTKYHRLITAKNSDRLLVVAQNGVVKILDGYAFSNTTSGIAIERLGVQHAASIVPIHDNVEAVLLLTECGYGKLVDIDTAVKTTKSKIMVLADTDQVISAVPVNSLDPENIVVLWAENSAYCVKLGEFPVLRRLAAGNRILKLDAKLIGASIIPSTAGHILLYGDYGYAKLISTASLKYNRKRPQTITMGNRLIAGAIGIETSGKLAMYSAAGKNTGDITVSKLAQLSLGELTTRFKPGTTISAPVKVLRIGHNEFYQLNSI